MADSRGRGRVNRYQALGRREVQSTASDWAANYGQEWKFLELPKVLKPGTEKEQHLTDKTAAHDAFAAAAVHHMEA